VVTCHLTKCDKITPAFLNILKDKYPNKNATSTTPMGRPTFLSSDKMSTTAPQKVKFTTQTLSQYLGFCSLKYWTSLYDACLPNFTFTQSLEPLHEVANLANIKKSRCNKTPIDHPASFLKVVHCDVSLSDCKSVGNGALYCLVLVDIATRYTWIYPL